MFVLTIILLQTQTNHIISLWKSTKTKQIILQPKAPAKIVEFIFDHRVKDHYSANKNETCNSITAIKKKRTKKIATQNTCQIFETHIWWCILWSTMPRLEQTLLKIGIYWIDWLPRIYPSINIFDSGHSWNAHESYQKYGLVVISHLHWISHILQDHKGFWSSQTIYNW